MKEKIKNIFYVIIGIAMFAGLVWLMWIDSKPDPTEGVNVLQGITSITNERHVAKNKEVTIKSQYDFFFATSPTTHITIPSNKTAVLKDMLFKSATLHFPDGVELRYFTIDLFPKEVSWSMWTGDSTNTITASGYTINLQAIVYITNDAPSNGEISLDLPNLSAIEQELNATATFPKDNIRSGNKLSLQSIKVHDSVLGLIYANIAKWSGVAVLVIFLLVWIFDSSGQRIRKGVNLKKFLDNGRKDAEARGGRFESAIVQIDKQQMNVSEAYKLANRYIWRTITWWVIGYILIYIVCTSLVFFLSFFGLIFPILGYFGKTIELE
jgi:hypothetical protein